MSLLRNDVVQIDDLRLEFLSQGEVNEALRGVSLKIGEGEIVGLVGESGSGKSVTAMNILQLLPASKIRIPTGKIRVLGHDVLTLEEKELRNVRGAEVSMIFQEPMTALNPVLRISEQMLDVIQRHQKVAEKEAMELSLNLLKEMSIPDPERVYNSFPHELSGGMRQRVMIAMAFSCSPRMIIADEPTTALDVTIQAQILNLLKIKAEKTGTAILMITHDLAVVAQLCNRVYVMYRGEIVEEGNTSDVIGRPQHAYTRALLNSIPEGKEPKTRLATIAASMLEDGLSVHEQSEVEEAVSEAIVPNSEATGRNILEVNGGTVQYPKSYDLLGRAMTYLTAVDHVDLTILEGETLSIVGESGCGKTSLANAIVGLVPIADGTIKYKGIDINEQEASTRREIQIVFQDPQASLDPRWPVWRIMTEPLTVIQDYSRLELRRQAMELCEMVGLDPNQIDRLPHEFSGGQRQRIAIGRALSVRPRLLVLDEPTSALDVSVQAQILNLLLDLQKNYNLSYLFISHDVAVVRHISDRVAVMYMGEIVEFGDAQTILSAPQHDYTRTLMNAVPMLANAFPS